MMNLDRFFYKNGSHFAFSPLQIAEGMANGLQELTEADAQALLNPAQTEHVYSCSKLQGELVLLEEPSPDPAHPTMLHWVEATVGAEQDPIRKRTMLAYLNAPTWRSNDPLVPVMWQAAGRDLSELPGVFQRAQEY